MALPMPNLNFNNTAQSRATGAPVNLAGTYTGPVIGYGKWVPWAIAALAFYIWYQGRGK